MLAQIPMLTFVFEVRNLLFLIFDLSLGLKCMASLCFLIQVISEKATAYIYTVDGSQEECLHLNLHADHWIKWPCLLQRTLNITKQVRKTSKNIISKEGFQQPPYHPPESQMSLNLTAFLLCNTMVFAQPWLAHSNAQIQRRHLEEEISQSLNIIFWWLLWERTFNQSRTCALSQETVLLLAQ